MFRIISSPNDRFTPRDTSDVDDTVKMSQITDKQTLLENTFLKPFVMAPGMAALYRKLAERGAGIVGRGMSPVLNACRAVWDGMVAEGGGVIINMASDAAKIATPGKSVIGASLSAMASGPTA